MLLALKDADSTITKLKEEKQKLEVNNRELSAHLALANNRIDFSKQDIHSMWKELIFHREKYHVLLRQHQEVLHAHSTCATGPLEQPYLHLSQEFEKLQDMYRHILGQNTTFKFETQRLMQQCVNAGLIPPPQNYTVTPIPALQPVRSRYATMLHSNSRFSACSTARIRTASLRACNWPSTSSSAQQGVFHAFTTTVIHFSHLQKAPQPGSIAQQLASPPSNSYTRNPSIANNPTIAAGPIQAYNYHRAQFTQPQQPAAQPMPPPQSRGQHPVFQQQIPATRPRRVIDLTDSGDGRASKRPRMTSDSNGYAQHSPGPVVHPQRQMHTHMPTPTPHQVLQQRNPQLRAHVVPMNHMQAQPTHQYHSQRSGPLNSYQQVPSSTSSTRVGRHRENALSDIPPPHTSTPLAMEGYGTVTDERGGARTRSQFLDGQMQVIGRPQQAYADPSYFANVASPVADAGIKRGERSTGTTVGSTPIATPPRVTTDDQIHDRESSLPSLTEEQTRQMRSEVADSMFTEPQEGDGTEARTCVLCE